MFRLAADYERKAKAAEALEASWRDRYNEDAPVAPKETDAVENNPRASLQPFGRFAI